MTPDDFRRLALALPAAVEGCHHGHADFRVGGKVFASLAPDESWGMVRLPPDLQAALVKSHPEAFQPFAGAWGRQGCTKVVLAEAAVLRVEPLLRESWSLVGQPRSR